MSALRLLVGLVVLAYALAAAAVGAGVAAFKLDRWTPPAFVSPEELTLASTIGWPQLALWALAILLYLLVAIKLFRRVKAFLTWAMAFVLSAANWLWLRASPAYEAATPPDLANIDYGVLGGSLLIGLLILWMGRTHLD